MSEQQTTTTQTEGGGAGQTTQQTQQTHQTTQASQSTDFRSYLDDKGNFTSKAWAGEETSVADKFTSLGALVKSYRTLERMNSNGNKVAIPGDTATVEERAAFYKALGRPDTIDGYEIKAPEKIGDKPFPKELWSDDRAKAFAKWAHEKGWSKQQVHDAIAFQSQNALGDLEAIQNAQREAYETAINALKGEWGKDYDAKVKAAEEGAGVVGLSVEVLKSNPQLSNNPHFIKAMAKVAEMTREKPAAGMRTGQADLGQDVQGQINAIMGDKKNPYWIKGHPQQQQMVAKLQGLYAQLHPDVKE
jgi:hypothetical protein